MLYLFWNKKLITFGKLGEKRVPLKADGPPNTPPLHLKYLSWCSSFLPLAVNKIINHTVLNRYNYEGKYDTYDASGLLHVAGWMFQQRSAILLSIPWIRFKLVFFLNNSRYSAFINPFLYGRLIYWFII